MIIKGGVEKEGKRKKVKTGMKCHTSRSIMLILCHLQTRERHRHRLEGRAGVSVIDGEIPGGKSPHESPL